MLHKAIQKCMYTAHVTQPLFWLLNFMEKHNHHQQYNEKGVIRTDVTESKDRWLDRDSHANTSKPARQVVYQRRSGDRLFGAGDHIGLVVDLEGQSGQTGRQTGDKAEVTRLSVKQSLFMQLLWREKWDIVLKSCSQEVSPLVCTSST